MLFRRKWREVSSRGLFPVCLSFLELDASLLDINVRCDFALAPTFILYKSLKLTLLLRP